MDIEFVTADERYNAELNKLARLCPMQGTLDAYYDQSPDFFRFIRMKDDPSITYVALANKEVVGCFTISFREVNYNGKVLKSAVYSELKVSPAFRGKKIGVLLGNQYTQQAVANSCEVGECAVMENNIRSLKTIAKHNCDIYYAGIARIYQIIPFRTYPEIKGYHIRQAEEKDLEIIAELLQETYKNYRFSPIFTKDYLVRELRKSDSFTVKNFMVAEKNAKIVACAAFWDEHDIRRIVLVHSTFKLKLLKNVLRLAKPFLFLPKFPKPGGNIEQLYIRFPACAKGEIQALRALFHAECNKISHLKKYLSMVVAFHEADPLSEVVSHMWKTKVNANLIHFFFSKDIIPPADADIHNSPVYFDYSIS